MSNQNNYPLEIKDISAEASEEVFKYFSEGVQDGFVRVGPKGYFFTNGFKADAANIYNMPLRPDDTFVVTFPKAGTTWTQELVWMVLNDFDYEKSAAITLPLRFPFLEVSMVLNSDKAKEELRKRCNGNERHLKILESMQVPGTKVMADLPSPRFIKTHLPLSLLPPSLLDTTKVVYVARDPRDIVVSNYYHYKLYTFMGFTGDLKTFWDFTRKDMLDWCPYFEHVKEAWEQRHHPNMLFIFYEDMIKDLRSTVLRVAEFFGKQVTEEQLVRVCDHLSFANFKNNKSVNNDMVRELGWFAETGSYIRRGKAGGWREYFDEEMTREAEQWIQDNLRDTDFRLPETDIL